MKKLVLLPDEFNQLPAGRAIVFGISLHEIQSRRNRNNAFAFLRPSTNERHELIQMTKIVHLRTIPRGRMTVSKFDIPKFGSDLRAVINDIFPLTTTCTEASGGP